MNWKLILLVCGISANLHGTGDRPRFVDPEKQALFAASSVTYPLPGRERRGGKKTSNESESESNNTNAPPAPPATVTNEVGEGPEDLVERIADLKVEREVLKAQIAELLADLAVASIQLQAASEERSELRKELLELTTLIDDGPGTIFSGWVFSPKLKWVYLSPTTMPYIFSQSDGWMIYEYGSSPRRVYYFRTEKWELLDEESDE
jgi:hypothetical protein